MNINTITSRTDVFLAIVGLGIGIAAIFASEYYNLNRTHLGYAISIACLIYLSIRNFLSERKSSNPSSFWQTATEPFVIVVFVFLIFLLTSIFVLRESLYYRNPAYFGFFLSAVAIVVLQITILDCAPTWKQAVLLGQILLLSISFRAGAFFLYPSVSGNDPFYHQRLIEELMVTGEVPESSYSPFPVMHLLAAVFCLVSGLTSKMGIFLVSILQSIALLGVFPIGKMLFEARTGLFAALLISLSDYQIQWGVQIIPMTLAIVFFILILLSLFERKESQKPGEKISWTIIIILFSSIMVLTHSLATLILFFALLVMMALPGLMRFINDRMSRSSILVSTTLSIIVGVGMLSYWMVSYLRPNLDFFSLATLSVKSALSTVELGNVESVSIAGSLNKWSVFLGEAGWTVLLIFSLVGALASFNNQTQENDSVVLTSLLGAFLGVTYGASVIGAAAILPARWIVFLYVPASLLVATVLSRLLYIQGKLKIMASLTTPLILFLILALMITSPTRSIPDSPLYVSNLSVRPGFYISEIEGFNYVKNVYGNNTLAASAKSSLYLDKAEIIDPRNPTTYEPASLIVHREYDMIKGFSIPFPKEQVIELVPPSESFADYLSGPSRLRVYDNGIVQSFLSLDFFTPNTEDENLTEQD
ncbi:MAG: glycosyltransferase family 39 protein [Anaerolineae bacterium]|nr:glycosyltransferase family 39 protein [Anaerolineae bacterium]